MPPRSRNIFDPASRKPFRISRSKLALFLECPRCFYLDRRLGVNRIGPPPFTLNTATDTLLKKEFDIARREGRPHRLMEQYHIDAVPFDHPHIDEWRSNFKGVQCHHEPTNLIITGAVDDIWVDPKGTLIVVDYKSTSTTKEIDIDGDPYKQPYKRQMEIYQWLLRRSGFTVSSTGYFVYVNADTEQDAFDGKLVFDEMLIPCAGNDAWVEGAIRKAHACLCANACPASGDGCAWCRYREAACEVLRSGSETEVQPALL